MASLELATLTHVKKEELEVMEKILAQSDEASPFPSSLMANSEGKRASMERSIFIGNLDYAAMTSDVELHFAHLGQILRVTIPTNRQGMSKAFAFLEFASKEAAVNALAMNETLIRGRPIKVTPMRLNRPGMKSHQSKPLCQVVVQGCKAKAEDFRMELRSSSTRVVLKWVEWKTAGNYRCEVTADDFETVSESKDSEVVAVPLAGPTITGQQTRYALGDIVKLNCTSNSSDPLADIFWYINSEARFLEIWNS
eukprot:snap_masked-scaffold322_size207131-processed-gene-1.11 protein:Tk09474 transcript:snap_masked-scaffold322_size207131-processed-gene-1.11-mRNA-1 annotation:"AGAP005117-PA"